MNPNIEGMYCILCGREWKTDAYPSGCEACREKGVPSSVSVRYSKGFSIDSSYVGMARYHSVLPLKPEELVYLGEGGTPLVPLKRLASELGVRQLFSKNEFQNPTGSHKDRMNPFLVAYAREKGYARIAAASSGNEGVSLACYAAAAGIPCTIVTTRGMNPIWKNAILSAGAEILYTEDPYERWECIRRHTESGEWFSATNFLDPPVGSCCLGVQGYKTIAYELYEQMPGQIADDILVPVSRGDLLWGIYEGFEDLKRAGLIRLVPRLIAVEPFPRLSCVKTTEDCGVHYQGTSSQTPSIGGNTATVQSFLALKNSGGFAVSAPQESVEGARNCMARNGLYLENSSALLEAALRSLLESGKIRPQSSVVMVATSHGFKNSY